MKGSADIGTATSGLPTRLVPHRESLCHSHRPRLEQGPCADSSGFVPIAELNSNGAVPANSDQTARQGLCQWPAIVYKPKRIPDVSNQMIQCIFKPSLEPVCIRYRMLLGRSVRSEPSLFVLSRNPARLWEWGTSPLFHHEYSRQSSLLSTYRIQ